MVFLIHAKQKSIEYGQLYKNCHSMEGLKVCLVEKLLKRYPILRCVCCLQICGSANDWLNILGLTLKALKTFDLKSTAFLLKHVQQIND